MAERALAHVEKIEWIRPIEGADNMEKFLKKASKKQSQ